VNEVDQRQLLEHVARMTKSAFEQVSFDDYGDIVGAVIKVVEGGAGNYTPESAWRLAFGVATDVFLAD